MTSIIAIDGCQVPRQIPPYLLHSHVFVIKLLLLKVELQQTLPQSISPSCGAVMPATVLFICGVGSAESALWNTEMSKFQNRSSNNIPSVTQTRASPNCPFVNPPGVNLDERRGAQAQPLARQRHYFKVAIFDGETCDVRGLWG